MFVDDSSSATLINGNPDMPWIQCSIIATLVEATIGSKFTDALIDAQLLRSVGDVCSAVFSPAGR
jgi:hypothetical protein